MPTKKNASKTSQGERKTTTKDGAEAARRQALAHEKAGHWLHAVEEWASVERLANSKKAREEAAGRKAAAWVRAHAKRGAKPVVGDADTTPKEAERSTPSAADTSTTGPTGEPAKPTRERDPRLPPIGTPLSKRDRAGQERARCTVVESGVEYNGTVYRSLSAAAVAAAKDLGLKSTTQDGYAFWQLKAATPREKDPIGALERAWERYRERAASAAKTAGDDDRTKIHGAISQHLSALNLIAAQVA
jgi:hypothetical protein